MERPDVITTLFAMNALIHDLQMFSIKLWEQPNVDQARYNAVLEQYNFYAELQSSFWRDYCDHQSTQVELFTAQE